MGVPRCSEGGTVRIIRAAGRDVGQAAASTTVTRLTRLTVSSDPGRPRVLEPPPPTVTQLPVPHCRDLDVRGTVCHTHTQRRSIDREIEWAHFGPGVQLPTAGAC